MGIQLFDRVARADGHLAEEIEGQIVLLSIEAGNYYGLDEIASEIWRMLESEISVSDLCAILATRYQAPTETIQSDVAEFLGRLLDQGLITAK